VNSTQKYELLIFLNRKAGKQESKEEKPPD
jgi:hypothetical protein